jgi:NitT/TauT family transport system substrate-binding protein
LSMKTGKIKKMKSPLIKIPACVLLTASIAFSTTACGPKPTPAPTPVTVQLAWTHTAQFAGMYAADQKGYYAAENMTVTFVEGGPSVDSIETVLSGAAHFGIASADVLLLARSAGKAVDAFAVIFRRSPRVYVALASSGIARPQDFVGKIIAVNSTGRAPFEAMMKRIGIRPDQYTLVNSTSDLASFYSGQVQVRSVYLTNEILTMRAAGYKVNIIYPDDYGIHNYGDALIATEALIKNQPDLVLRFLRATLKGWTYAVEHPSEMGAMVVKYNAKADPALENEKMAAGIPLINTGEDHIGWMRPEIWSGMEQILREQGVLTASLDVTQTYTMRFLEEIYGK